MTIGTNYGWLSGGSVRMRPSPPKDEARAKPFDRDESRGHASGRRVWGRESPKNKNAPRKSGARFFSGGVRPLRRSILGQSLFH
jgi:hypothetical protein